MLKMARNSCHFLKNSIATRLVSNYIVFTHRVFIPLAKIWETNHPQSHHRPKNKNPLASPSATS